MKVSTVVQKIIGLARNFSRWVKDRRPVQLVFVVAITIAIAIFLDGKNGGKVSKTLFSLSPESVADVRFFSALFYAVIFTLGLPVAFLIWHWRDKNVRDQIENARKDVNLKEFQEVQLRAAGALDEKLPLEAQEQLQIAALHQLRGFLRGDYGKSFRRPAFELLMAGHAAAINRIGAPAIKIKSLFKSMGENQREIFELKAKLTPVDKTRINIIKDEAKFIFLAEYPLMNRNFQFIDLVGFNFPEDVRLWGSDFYGADLSWVVFKNVDLSQVMMTCAQLSNANFEGTKLSNCDLRNSNLVDATFNDKTLFIEDNHNPLFSQFETQEAKETMEANFRALGARHINDPLT